MANLSIRSRDKLLICAAMVVFIDRGLMYGWMVFIILAREFIITSLRTIAAMKGTAMAAAWSGKVKTCVQIAGVILIFLCTIVTGCTEPADGFDSCAVDYDGGHAVSGYDYRTATGI